jgi:hypothetical protein
MTPRTDTKSTSGIGAVRPRMVGKTFLQSTTTTDIPRRITRWTRFGRRQKCPRPVVRPQLSTEHHYYGQRTRFGRRQSAPTASFSAAALSRERQCHSPHSLTTFTCVAFESKDSNFHQHQHVEQQQQRDHERQRAGARPLDSDCAGARPLDSGSRVVGLLCWKNAR